jgi:hypothetical protein
VLAVVVVVAIVIVPVVAAVVALGVRPCAVDPTTVAAAISVAAAVATVVVASWAWRRACALERAASATGGCHERR